MRMNVKIKLYEESVSAALCVAEIWSMAVVEKKRVNVMEMRSMCGVMHMN